MKNTSWKKIAVLTGMDVYPADPGSEARDAVIVPSVFILI